MVTVIGLRKICRGDIPEFLIVPPSPSTTEKNKFFACIADALLYKWFTRVRGQAATQAINSMYLFNFTKRFAAFDKGSIPSRILSSAFKM